MGGLLDLKNATRIWHGGTEVQSLWIAGNRWNRPKTIADYYGVGAGKIAIHLNTTGATISGGMATALQNLGGAGAMFDGVSNPTTGLPVVNTNFIQFNGTANRFTLANKADLMNVRMFTLMSFDDVVNNARLFGATATDGTRYEVMFLTQADGRKMLRYNKIPPGSTTLVQQTGWSTGFPSTGVHLMETELTDTLFNVYIDGVLIASVATIADFVGVPYLAEYVGAGFSGTNGIVANIGEILGITLGAGSNEAVDVVRSYISNKYGIPVALHSPLSRFYGVGAGKIAIHFDTGSVIGPQNGVTALINKGGGGAAFDAPVTGQPLVVTDNMVTLSNTTGTPRMTTRADIVGVRLMWVCTVDSLVTSTKFFGATGYEIRVAARQTDFANFVQLWSNATGEGIAISLTPRARFPERGKVLLELETTPDEVRLWMNGQLQSSYQTPIPWSEFYLQLIGQGNTATIPFAGQMGDVLAVTLGVGSDEAIEAARSHLATKHSITL